MLTVTVVALAGCGGFQPFATPFVPRPALPMGEAWPVPAEVVVDRLEDAGYTCDYAPDSDIPGGWSCAHEGAPAVSLNSQENGPIRSAHAFMFDGSEPPPPKEAMDGRAVEVFGELVLPALLPEAVIPSDAELLVMIQENWPVELGEGWLLGFDRASNQRTLYVVYVEPTDDS